MRIPGPVIVGSKSGGAVMLDAFQVITNIITCVKPQKRVAELHLYQIYHSCSPSAAFRMFEFS